MIAMGAVAGIMRMAIRAARSEDEDEEYQVRDDGVVDRCCRFANHNTIESHLDNYAP
jgi:hypothetical protein